MGSPDFRTKEKSNKLSLLFVCLGNICRSPAADGIMHRLVENEGLTDRISIDSAGTYGGHAGGLPDARMRQHAQRRGYNLTHRARRVVVDDFDRFDLILAMDDSNYDDLMRLAPDIASQKKVHKMVSFCKNKLSDHVPDPYYEGAAGFEKVLDILEDACHGLLMSIKNKQL